MGMARNQLDCGRLAANMKVRGHPQKAFNKNTIMDGGSPLRKSFSSTRHESSFHRYAQRSPSNSGPRTSPGLLAGHYAGCKFSEPPSPSTLPLPPVHWTQSSKSVKLPCTLKNECEVVSQQLKVLLKVQA